MLRGWNTCFTITLPGALAAADIRDRVEPTAAGRAYAACLKAEEDCLDACADVQEGASPSVLDGPCHRQAIALADFREATGTDFYAQKVAEAGR